MTSALTPYLFTGIVCKKRYTISIAIHLAGTTNQKYVEIADSSISQPLKLQYRKSTIDRRLKYSEKMSR